MTDQPPGPLHLTFDDGPDPICTPAVLHALERRGAQATFFVLGAAVRDSPGTIDEILSAGHRVELHGHGHLDHRTAPHAALMADTEEALEILGRVAVRPQWWRLPWGRPGPATQAVADHFGLRIVRWDLDTHDWRGDAWDDQPAGTASRAAQGAVVLLHDGFGPGATRVGIGNTIGLVDAFADVAREHGQAMRPLSDPSEAPPGAPAFPPPGRRGAPA